MTDLGHPAKADGLSQVEPVPVSIAFAIAEIRTNSKALASWFDGLSEHQRDALGFMGGGYGLERQARDALECAFRLASSSIHAMNMTADALDEIAKAMSTGTAKTEGLGPQDASAVAASDLPDTPKETDHD